MFLYNISDHQCTFISININSHTNYKERKQIRIMNNKNIEKFKDSLEKINENLIIIDSKNSST